MLISILICLLLSNAVTTIRDKSILFSRIIIKSLLLTSFLAYSNFYIKPISMGISLYGGLLNVTTFLQSFIIFILVISALIILAVTEFYTKKVQLTELSFIFNLLRKKEFSISFIITVLMFFSIKGPAKFISLQLGIPWLYYIICGFIAMLSCTIYQQLLEKEVYKTIQLILLALLSILITWIADLINFNLIDVVALILSFSAIPLSSNGHSSLVLLLNSNDGQAGTGEQTGAGGQASGNVQGGAGLQGGAGGNALPGMGPNDVITPIDASRIPRAHMLFSRGFRTDGESNKEAGRMMASHLLYLKHINIRAGNNVITPEMTTWLHDWSRNNNPDFHQRMFPDGRYPTEMAKYCDMRNTIGIRKQLWNLP